LADACVRLLGDPPLRNALGIAARQRVLRGLTWPAMTETLVRMYAKVRSL
jgi:glycosyltransferase involved in cell wall biosynthesis